MKVTLRDERLELETPYGKLLIPVADIQRIEFAWRVPDDVAKRIETALGDLGNEAFQRRQEAQVASREIRRVELGMRLPENVAKRIETAVAGLSNDDFKAREAAARSW